MIPEITRQWIASHAVENTGGVEQFRRGLIIRWLLWLDGVRENAIPGYDAPPPDCGKGHPHGWSRQAFKSIAMKAKQESIRIAITRR